MATKALRPYQVKDLAFYIANPKCINRSKPATGKTGAICVMCEYVYTREDGGTIWIMPSSLLQKNIEELLDFTNFKREDVWLFKSRPNKSELNKKYAVIVTTADTFTLHFETIKTYLRKPLKFNPCDEPHLYYSTHSSKRTQFWLGATQKIPRVIPMTGTITRGRLDSAYPFIQMVEPRYYGSYGAFMNQHAEYDGMGEIVGWQNFEKIGRILNKHSINRSFEECYGKENKVIIPVPLDMSERMKEAYDKFHEEAYLELNDDSVLSATTEGVVTIRCRQILGSPHKFHIHKETEWTPKEEWVRDNLLSGQFSSGVLFSALKDEQLHLVKLVESLGFKVGLINGDVSQKKRVEIDLAFQKGELDWIIASPITAGVGFNWGRAETVCFVSTDYMDDSFVQGYKRAMRGVREVQLIIYVLRYNSSIEYRVLDIIQQKSEMAHKVDPTCEKLTGLIYSRS